MTNKNNTGLENTGNYNSGDCNSGNRNSGYYNSGDCNSGNRNSGYYNSGYYNSGNYNSGNYNSGDCNSGDYNSGWFNTNEPKMRTFNKDSDYTYTEFRDKFGYNEISLPVCAWVYYKDMSEQEKKDIPIAQQMDGYLKVLDYKEAWAVAWEKATK